MSIMLTISQCGPLVDQLVNSSHIVQWIEISLGVWVVLGQGHIVLDGSRGLLKTGGSVPCSLW